MNIDGKRLMSNLAALRQFTDTPGEGVTRFSYGEQDAKARRFLADRARKSGCSVTTDPVGNVRISLPSNVPGRPVILCGSHIDTVRNGGWLDGIYGVCSALEVLQTLAEREAGAQDTSGQAAGPQDAPGEATDAQGGPGPDPGAPACNVELVIFAEEEGSNFGSTMTGSKFLTGKYTAEDLDRLTVDDGRTMMQVLQASGLSAESPAGLATEDLSGSLAWDLSDAAAMLELHIEQGPILDRADIPIGIVDSIFGMRVVEVTLTGVGNHAGATPMGERFDALATAAECILAAEGIADDDSEERTVATIGKLEVRPNCSNVIPETVRFTVEVRDRDREKIDDAMDQIIHEFREIAFDRNVHCQVREHSSSLPLRLDDGIRDRIREAAERAGTPCLVMDSGAVHDACMIAEAGVPTGMIFVPSIDGRSHVPEEDTREEDLIRGARLLLEVVEGLRKGH